MEIFLDDHLGLQVKEKVQLNRSSHGIPFIGYRVFADHLRLSQVARRRFRVTLKRYEYFYEQGLWSGADFQRHVEPLVAYVKRAASKGLRRAVMG